LFDEAGYISVTPGWHEVADTALEFVKRFL